MSHAEETRAIDEASSRRETPRGRLLVRVALSTLFLLSSLPLGIFWFLVLVVLVLIGLPLTLVWIGLPILALAMLVSIVGATPSVGVYLRARWPLPGSRFRGCIFRRTSA